MRRNRGPLAMVVLAILLTGIGCASMDVKPVPMKSAAVSTGDTWFNTGSNCASQPSIDRVFGEQRFQWTGVEYVLVNEGNEIGIYEAENMRRIDVSSFNVGNVGDSDYDLQNFSIYDNCRYGVANYKRGTVFFELGEVNHRLGFRAHNVDYELRYTPGAYVYQQGDTVYLVAEYPGDPESALYEYEDVFTRTKLSSLVVPGKTPKIVGGDRAGDYLYLVDLQQRVYLFEITGSHLTYISTPWTTYGIKDSGQSFENDLAVVANSTGLHLFDVSAPETPSLSATITGDFNRSSLAYPLVFAARKGFVGSERTYNISSGAFVETHASFWDQTQPWNHPGHQCAEVQSGAFIDGGDTLILSRYAFGDSFDVSGWIPESPLIFRDNFETANFSRWSSVIQ